MASHPKNLRVLYLEDNQETVDLVQRSLQRMAPWISIDVAPSLAAARAKVAAASPVYDLVLADIGVADGSGLELLAHIRGTKLPVVVIILTGSGDQELAVAALKAGADDYLLKHGDYIEHLHERIFAAYERFQEKNAFRSRNLKVLYAEDNPYDADLTSRHFARHAPHIQLQTVTSGAALLKALKMEGEQPLPYDVLLFDFRLPDTNALELARLVRVEGGIDLPVVVVSGQGNESVVADALRMGVADYLIKHPGYLAELPAILEQAHRQAQLEREHAALLASDKKLRILSETHNLILENINDGILMVDAVTKNIVFANPEICRLLGHSCEELLTMTIMDIHPTKELPAIIAQFERHADGDMELDKEIPFLRQNGKIFYADIKASKVQYQGRSCLLGVIRDCGERRQAEERLQHMALHDQLTGLANRLLLEARLEHSMERAKRKGGMVALLAIDLDMFKKINESLGHSEGDKILVEVARRFSARLRDEDTLARWAGDEFGLVLDTLHSPQEAEIVVRSVQATLEAPCGLSDGTEAYMRASIGISIYPQDGDTAQALLSAADAALHQAKKMGGNQFCYYAGDLNIKARSSLEMESALRRALDNGEFLLHYQPKVDLNSGRVLGAEALLRWQRPGSGMVPPLEFIPLAEKCGLIEAIGSWVIEEACQQMQSWRAEGLAAVGVAVNVSAVQFRGKDLQRQVCRMVEHYGVELQHLMLELTESILMEAPADAVERMQQLKNCGVAISLDDFGTGYSSLAYLSRFPIDQLKIDRSFVNDITTDPSAATIASAIIALGHRLGLAVLAEGVETEAQLGYLRKQGCDEMQGYYFSRPLPAADFVQLLREAKKLAIPDQDQGLRTLLLVDDDADVLAILRQQMDVDGYRILTAGSGSDALELLAKNAVQVIVSDQRMPQMTGIEFLSRVKALYPDTVRMLLTAYADLETVIEAVNDGAVFRILGKPWKSEQLRGYIREAFRYHEAMSLMRK